MNEERAVLAGGCSFGACRISFAHTTAFCPRGLVTPAAACPTLPTKITAHTRKQSKSSLTLRASAIEKSSNCSSRFTTRARVSPGQRRREQLSVGDLLHQRRAEAYRRRYDRRCGCFGPVARQGCDRSGSKAEPEHQDYLQRNPGGYTCHFIRPNWKLPTRTEKVVNVA
jgi:hypothetical protein